MGLFAGVGGFELGLAKAGHEARLLCEIDPGARAVLAARFPGARLHVLSNCSHMPFYEDPAAYFGVLVPFLRAQDGQARPMPSR